MDLIVLNLQAYLKIIMRAWDELIMVDRLPVAERCKIENPTSIELCSNPLAAIADRSKPPAAVVSAPAAT